MSIPAGGRKAGAEPTPAAAKVIATQRADQAQQMIIAELLAQRFQLPAIFENVQHLNFEFRSGLRTRSGAGPRCCSR